MTTEVKYGLSCLDATDPGAVALYMQRQALAIEAQLGAQQDEFNGFLHAPTAIVATNVAQVMLAGAATVGILGSGGQLATVFSNYTFTDFVPTGATFATGNVSIPDDEGAWWHAGCYVSMVAAGAITALSLRQIILQVTSYVTPSGINGGTTFGCNRFDSSTAGEHLMTEGTFYVPAGSETFLSVFLQHQNAASNVNIPIGATIWLTRLGSGDLIGSL